MNSLVAPYEELTSRGSGLMRYGETWSSIEFGSLHLANALMPNVSVEDTVQQVLFATLFGFYAARYTVDNGYDIRRMIAFHFWWNVTAMTLSYMADPDSGLYLSFMVPIRF